MTQQAVRHRPPPGAAGAARARPSLAHGPLVAAGAVLLAWGGWLLVPEDARLDLLGAPSSAGTNALTPAALAVDEASRGRVEAPVPAVGPGPGTLARPGTEPSAGPSTPPSAGPSAGPAARPAAEPGPAPVPTAQPSGAVPDQAPAAVPRAGDGTFAVAPGTGEQVGDGALVRYTVEVEGGVPLDAADVAAQVEAVLADPRSWTGQGRWALQRVDSDPDARIVVTSPDTTDRMCAPLRTRGELSCRNGDDVVLNADRWTSGARSWGEDVAGYRQYLVNHELGHLLGNGHVPCPEDGAPAPVMLQQTIGLQGCAPNAWPYP